MCTQGGWYISFPLPMHPIMCAWIPLFQVHPSFSEDIMNDVREQLINPYMLNCRRHKGFPRENSSFYFHHTISSITNQSVYNLPQVQGEGGSHLINEEIFARVYIFEIYWKWSRFSPNKSHWWTTHQFPSKWHALKLL